MNQNISTHNTSILIPSQHDHKAYYVTHRLSGADELPPGDRTTPEFRCVKKIIVRDHIDMVIMENNNARDLVRRTRLMQQTLVLVFE